MALKECKECGKEVSSKASKCPNCGVANPTLDGKQVAQGCLIIILAFCALVSLPFILGENKPPAPLTPAEQREQLVQNAFSGWDGSHIALTKMIKASMNDPSSYKHIETRYIDQNDKLLVIAEFSGANAFGGMVRSVVKAYTNPNSGEVIEIISQD